VRPGARLSRVAVRVVALGWRRDLPGASALTRRVALAALAQAQAKGSGATDGATGGGELCLVLGDDALARQLNRDFRGQDRPTNVLSFPAGEPTSGQDAVLGDVVLARETVAAEAVAQGKSLADHVSHLVVHGVLHLLGFDHKREAAARRMEQLERRILAGLGVADPYRSRRRLAAKARRRLAAKARR